MGTLFEMPPAPEPGRGDRLNPEQRRAVEHGEGPLVVIAGAGTGKTLVIVERIRRLLETRPDLFAGEILALTYTRKAAGEMAWRVRKGLGERAQGLVATTFHAFCADLLRQVNPGLRQITELQHWILLRTNMARLGLVRFRRLADPGQFLSDFTKFFSRCQDELVGPEEYRLYAERLAAAAAHSGDADAREEAEEQVEIARAYAASEALLREKNLLTFGGSIVESVRLLERDAPRLAGLRRRFRFLLVDEFQDTNVAQIRLLELLAGEPRNLFVVGDDDQAIYRFRGASFASFRVFEKQLVEPHAAGASPGASRVLLKRNYRSTKRILKVAGSVIAMNGVANRLFPDKGLVTSNPEGARVRIVLLRGHAEEAEWIADQIEAEQAHGAKLGSFAVLYRQHKHRDLLVRALVRRRIPFLIRGLSMLASPVVRDVVACLRWIDSPGDNAALARLLAIPRWGLRAEDLVRLAQSAAKNPRTSLWDALGERAARGAAPGRATELPALHRALAAAARQQPVIALLDEIAVTFDMLPLPEGPARNAFTAFRRFVEEWEVSGEPKGLHAFLQYLLYYEQAGGGVRQDEEFDGDEAEEENREKETRDAVELMTVHAAKGLEFDHVFVMRLCHLSFPPRRMPPLFKFPDELMKVEPPKDDQHVIEERRLFYVALTRARKHLTLTTIREGGSKPSPFLDDIDQEMHLLGRDVEKLVPHVALPPEATPGETMDPEDDAAGAAPPEPRLFTTPPPYRASQIGAWSAAYRPPVEIPLELSASSVDTYFGCPLRYMFGSRWSIRGRPSGSMTFGNVMHTTIRHFMKEVREGRRPTLDDVLLVYDREWKSTGFEDSYQEESFREAGREQLCKFHARVMAAPPNVREQEKAFALPLARDVVLTGRMDQINVLPGGAEIVDYKTGTPRTEKNVKKSLQLSVYAFAAREALELSVARVAFHYLHDDTVVTATRDAKDLAEAQSRIQEAAAGIRAGHFPARPDFNCRFCDYRLICPAHERSAPAAEEASNEE